MLANSPYQPDRSLKAKLVRRMTQYRQAVPAKVSTKHPILSLTFDDCPASAATTGREILEAHGVKGGFYIATGMLGKETHMGKIVTQEDVHNLAERGHEIGAHSHSHLDCAKHTSLHSYEDVLLNLDQLKRICPGYKIESFAFPYGETSFQTKKKLSGLFHHMRGILPGINRGPVDRAQLRAFEITQSDCQFERAMQALKDLAQNPGWMFMFTHDVSNMPSHYGMTPEQLDQMIKHAKALGVEILPPTEAAKKAGLS